MMVFLSVDHLLRTASQHSDSSGFAEDSTESLSINHLQVKLSIVVGTVINCFSLGDFSVAIHFKTESV